ncbi:MAG: DUF4382 domain-containing protein [Candidatus Schekmanbacteria bacterium]|nr:MAG: DUF4382 domain-containing protein [Candidatus Schekmanbacteria bacterium]
MKHKTEVHAGRHAMGGKATMLHIQGKRKKNQLANLPLLFVALFFLFFNTIACEQIITSVKETQKKVKISKNRGKVIVYFNGAERTGINLTITIDNIRIKSEKGEWIRVSEKRFQINSIRTTGEQVQIGEIFADAGKYRGMELTITDAILVEDGKEKKLLTDGQKKIVFIDFDFGVYPEMNTPLFIDWDPIRSVKVNYIFEPVFKLSTKKFEIRGVMTYVSNEDSGNISLIDRALRRVVSVIEVEEGPKGLVASPDGTRIFVANSRSDSVSVIDTNSNRVLQHINLESGSGPEEISILPDGSKLYIVNYKSNSVSVVNARSFQLLRTIPVGVSPIALDIDSRGRRVYVANSRSNDVSVIDALTDSIIASSIPVDSYPRDIIVDQNNGNVYVACYNSNNIDVISPSTLSVEKRLNTGNSVVAIVEDRRRPFIIYFFQQYPNRIVQFDTNSNLTIHTLRIRGFVRNLKIDEDRGKIYAVMQNENKVAVIDKLSRVVEWKAEVGKKPYDVLILR